MTIAMKHINQLIDEKAVIEDGMITYPGTNILIKCKPKVSIWKQIKKEYPDIYKKIRDEIFDELHPF